MMKDLFIYLFMLFSVFILKVSSHSISRGTEFKQNRWKTDLLENEHDRQPALQKKTEILWKNKPRKCEGCMKQSYVKRS